MGTPIKKRLSNEQEDKKQEMIHKLDFLHYRLCIKFKGRQFLKTPSERPDADIELLGALTDIVTYAKDMLSWVHEYDYKPSIPANGYRSLIRLTLCMMKAGLDPSIPGGADYQDLKNSASNQNSSDGATGYLKLVLYFREAIQLIQKLRCEQLEQQKMALVSSETSASAHPPLASAPIEMTIQLMKKFTENVDFFSVIFGLMEGFDKRPIVRSLTKVSHYLLAVKMAPSWIQMISSLFATSSEAITRLTAQRYMNHNVHQVASMLAGGRGFFYESILNVACNFGAYPNVMKTISVPRQSRWIIDANISPKGDNKVPNVSIRYQNNSSSIGGVRCRVYQELAPLDETPDGTLVIFTHGGGFITNSPESHEVSLGGTTFCILALPKMASF